MVAEKNDEKQETVTNETNGVETEVVKNGDKNENDNEILEEKSIGSPNDESKTIEKHEHVNNSDEEWVKKVSKKTNIQVYDFIFDFKIKE